MHDALTYKAASPTSRWFDGYR